MTTVRIKKELEQLKNSMNIETKQPEKREQVGEIIEDIKEELEEGKMSEIDRMSKDGKSAEEIAKAKMQDLNAFDLKEATKIICGSARSMGIEVKG